MKRCFPQVEEESYPAVEEWDPSKRRPLDESVALYEQWKEDGPPPALLLVSGAEAALLWRPLGLAAGSEDVRCMICKKGMKRNNWRRHMGQQHADPVCPFMYCGWRARSTKELGSHLLEYHDRLPSKCKQCPLPVFDRLAMLWRHNHLTHLNWAPNAFHADIGADPLHEDDDGGGHLESTADVPCDLLFSWEPPPPPQSSFGWADSASTEPSVGGSNLGKCITGGIPW